MRRSAGFKTTNKINNIIVLGTLCFVVNMSSERHPSNILYCAVSWTFTFFPLDLSLSAKRHGININNSYFIFFSDVLPVDYNESIFNSDVVFAFSCFVHLNVIFF